MREIGAHLDHLVVESDNPERLAAFWADTLGMERMPLDGGAWLVAGDRRRLVFSAGAKQKLACLAFHFPDKAALDAYRAKLTAAGLTPGASASPLHAGGGFSVKDPDGNTVSFGLPDTARAGGPLPARLQHVGIRTLDPDAMVDFYSNRIGLVVSDRVQDDKGVLRAAFLRADPEHHTVAIFRAPEARLDHLSFDTRDILALRDWADAMGRKRIPIFWGVGRHGPGNDLFFMVKDPDENLLEISTELEVCKPDRPMGIWPNEQWTLNQWGPAIMRS